MRQTKAVSAGDPRPGPRQGWADGICGPTPPPWPQVRHPGSGPIHGWTGLEWRFPSRSGAHLTGVRRSQFKSLLIRVIRAIRGFNCLFQDERNGCGEWLVGFSNGQARDEGIAEGEIQPTRAMLLNGQACPTPPVCARLCTLRPFVVHPAPTAPALAPSPLCCSPHPDGAPCLPPVPWHFKPCRLPRPESGSSPVPPPASV